MVGGSNEINAQLLNQVIDGIEKNEASMMEDRMSTMAKLKQRYVKPRQAIKDWLLTGVDGGIPKDELKRVLKERVLMRQLAKVSADVEPDSVEIIKQMRARLKPVADLPLFGAALEREERELAKAEASAPGAEVVDLKSRKSRKKGESKVSEPVARTKADDAELSSLLEKADEN